MNIFKFFFCVATLAIFTGSCKNNGQDGSSTATEDAVNEISKTVLTEEEQKVINSVLTKVMMTPELKTFASATVTAGLTDMLSKNNEPVTLLAPSNDAFGLLSKQKMASLLNPENKAALVTLLKNHMVEGTYTSAILNETLQENQTQTLTTLGGATLTVSKEGDAIVITDATGNRATLVKNDILGGNGVLHVMDAVLNAQ